MRDLARDDVLSLLKEVGEILVTRGIEAAIYVVGGSAMALEYDSRRITRDIDAQIREGRSGFWEAVEVVAQRHGIESDWVNSNAVAFMTNEADPGAHERNVPGLRIAVASPEHLIAMKLRSLRDRDMDDLEVLFRVVGITVPAEVVAIHNRLFDDSYVGYHSSEEVEYAVQAVFDRAAAQGRPINPPESAQGAT